MIILDALHGLEYRNMMLFMLLGSEAAISQIFLINIRKKNGEKAKILRNLQSLYILLQFNQLIHQVFI